ncbi:MAG: DUF2341 domain-containing protein, partial [Candidatus Hodarchaeota archaeon]
MKLYRKISKKRIKSLGILVVFLIIPIILSTPLFKFNNTIQENEEKDTINEKDFTPKLSRPPNENYFRYYKVITIDHTKVSGTGSHVNFPVLINITDLDLRDTSKVQANGNDIAFTDGIEWLDHEIELFDQTYSPTHAHLVAWVRIPSLSTSVDTVIRMYYGNSTMGARESPTNVWDSNFKGVWHLSESSGGTDAIKDSTVNANHGTDHGTPLLGSTGNIDGVIDLRGDVEDEYIEVVDSASIRDITEGDYFTYEAWFNPDQVPPGTLPEDNNRRYGILIKKDPHHGLYYEHDQYFAMEHWLAGPTQKYVSSGTYTPTSYYHVVAVVSNLDGYMKLYVNGNLEDQTTWTGGTTPQDYGTKRLRFGIANPGAAVYRWPADGKIDEFRISDSVRSIDWIKTEYNNSRDPDNFYSVSSAYRVYIPSFNDFKYFKEIIIDHTKVSGTGSHVNFPMLINITDLDLKTDVQANGNDIAFTDGNMWLDHEIELFDQNYSPTHAHLVAWVCIPSLSTSEDTIIRMYYGNSTMGPQECPLKVWDINYKAIWHLSEDPTGTIYDSTSNSNDGTAYGGMNSGDQVVGQIDGSLDFDGDNDYITTNYEGITGSNARTISFWMKTSSLSDRDIISYGSLNVNRFIIRIDESSVPGNWVIRLEMIDSAFSLREQRWSTHLADGNWHHVALVIPQNVDISQTIAYIDGQLDTVDTTYGTGIANSGSGGDYDFHMAFQLNKQEFYGTLDEVRVSNINRSADLIITEYNNQFNPNSFYSISSVYRAFVPSFNDFKYFKEITIDHTKVSGTGSHVNFPLLINITDSNLKTEVQANGEDIAFTDFTTWLDHEIELFDKNYNATHAHLVAWVRIPNLSTTEDTIIRMYYGNLTTMEAQEYPRGVWGANYDAIYHLAEAPTGGTGDIKDSTTNYNADSQNMESGDLTDGKIGKGLNFDGNNEYLDCMDSILGSGVFTISMWAYGDYPNTYNPLISQYQTGFAGRMQFTINEISGSYYFQIGDSHEWGADSFPSNDWTHLVVVRESDGDCILYENSSIISDFGITDSSDILDVNTNIGGGQTGAYWTGLIDEVRISKISHSAGWIATEYNNQYDPNSFYSIGINHPSNAEYFNYYKEIVIDHTKIPGLGNYANFPVLINLTDSDLRNDVQSNGNDIAFSKSNEWLDHEIELFDKTYNGTHAHLVAWVRIPKLSASIDTIIRMYYGNLTMRSQENSAGVWNTNYRGVWHLSESSGDALDSTSYGEDGTVLGVTQGINGQIDGAYD